MKSIFGLLLSLFLCVLPVQSQNTIEYREPAKEIKELIDYQKSPSVFLDKRDQIMLFLYSNTYNSIEEIAENNTINLAGLEINKHPLNYITNIEYKIIEKNELVQIEGLPQDAKLSYFVWSPDQSKIAFLNTTKNDSTELWYYDFMAHRLFFVIKLNLNSATERPFHWFNENAFLVKSYPSENSHHNNDNNNNQTITGPSVYFNNDSTVKRSRTYTNLLKNDTDEFRFDKAITSELYEVSLKGEMKLWKRKGTYIDISFSPNREYILITALVKPYSYTVPYTKFQRIMEVYDKKGNLIKEIDYKPAIENLPAGFMSVPQGKRSLSWRTDKPATLFWVEALDEGDPQKEAEYRDELFLLDAPFTDRPESILKVKDRFNKILWGNDDKAIVYTAWWKTRNLKAILFSPADSSFIPHLLEDRNYQDENSNSGNFDLRLNEYSYPVLNLKDSIAYLTGKKSHENKIISFIDEFNLFNLEKKRVFENDLNGYVNIISINDIDKGNIIISLESATKFPNYYLYAINKKELLPLTDFPNPFASIEKINKRIIHYMRADSVLLSGILYLPAGYDFEQKEKLPLLMWAYPQDYIDKKSAEQLTAGENEFTYLDFPSPVYWVTRGYAVFDHAAFPIVAKGKEYPNDTFVEQLILNAQAAINALDSLGYIDNKKVAVGGHSYGAFMVANLLTHSNLFSAGIALSGAYNRTLTPFGFQSEERTYWEAPQLYNSVSPFMYANKMHTPLLLIHGEKDSNVGTSVIQSERYYDALKSLGATSRLVILPYEDHDYKVSESILHVAWEIDQWLNTYMK